MVDYDGFDRAAKIEIIDPLTGKIFESDTITNYESGDYVSVDIRNYVDVRITPAIGGGGDNEVIGGIFFDSRELAAPVFTPSSGNFLGRTTVSMAATPGATILFTTDGTDPGAGPSTYNGPFVLTSNAVIRAKAVQNGFEDSAISSVSLTNVIQNAFVFVGVDTATQGDWMNQYGETGQAIADLSLNVPADVEASAGADPVWTWARSGETRAVNTYLRWRIASAWYSPTECVFDMTIYSNPLMEIALYFLDWDNQGRVQDL